MSEILPEDLNKYTVKISHEGEQKHDGSGFFVAPRLILTCAHVCLKHKNKSFYIHYQDQKIPCQVKLKFCSEDINQLDVALLEIEDTELEFPYILFDEAVAVGDELYSYGYPDNYDKGDVGTFEYIGIDGEGLFKFKEGNVRKGMSGSLLLNLRTKRVCGMVAITLDRNQALGGRGIPTKTILEALAEVKAFQLSCFSMANPFIPLTGSIENINQVFGRDSEIKRIFELLNIGSSVALIGESGIGKSSVLNAVKAQAEQQLRNPRRVINIDFDSIETDNGFYYELCDQVGIECDYDDPPRGTFLKRKLRQHRLLLLLDGLRRDMVWEGFTNPVRNQLRALANMGKDSPLRLVVAAEKPLIDLFKDSGSDSPFENVCIPITLNPWDELIMREFINHRLRDNVIRFKESEIQAVIKQSQGHPQRLMQLCYEIYRNKL